MPTDPLNNPVYAQLGVTPLINAGGTHTTHGGSMMKPEVREAMSMAAESFVDIVELKRATGDFIARITGAEAGLVTSGAAGGLVLAAAAVMTGTDQEKISRLPDTTGMKDEILTQVNNPTTYMKAHEYAGSKTAYFGDENGGSAEQLEAAISDSTAGILYTYAYGPARGGIGVEEIKEVASAKNVPVIVDGAAMLPPKENLTRFISEGADLVTYSGGKYIGGPQSAGLLAGRTDLVEAALKNSGPSMAVGRPQKVGREEMLGMVTALQLFIESDDAARQDAMRKRAVHISDRLQGIDGVSVSVEQDFLQFHVPNCVIRFDDPSRIDSVWEALHEGSPRIYIAKMSDGLAANPVNLSGDQEVAVADRLYEELSK
jgi:uncharacterized pyridoxal phosphate-dependent enzyme